MRIKFMRRAKDATFKTKAYFSIETVNFTIHRCRLVMAPTGRLVVHLPFREYMEHGRLVYEPIIEPNTVDYLEAVGEEAIRVYESLP